MTQFRITGVLLGMALIGIALHARAEGLRCGDRLASTGSSRYEVAATCGDPDDAEHTIETRVIERHILVPCGHRMCDAVVPETIEIEVDKWTYDFGSNRFIEFARFEQGVLVHVWNRGTYGHKDPT
ncbi:MAG TPA: DUF2845 domain-containing protein [Polyangiaceae bacterium]|nr:DUF2845 domain-containing protein [Polyangiaceae bacterium]